MNKYVSRKPFDKKIRGNKGKRHCACCGRRYVPNKVFWYKVFCDSFCEFVYELPTTEARKLIRLKQL